ncbi:MAG TPA: STAS-like domain-containing protein [Coleofasciculaceae cyanobacterium]
MKLKIYELFGENCMTQQAGQLLYEKIYPELKANQVIELDFEGGKRFLSVFFNFAIGQLLYDIQSEDLEQLLFITNLSPVGQQIYDRVLENAKQYYSNAEYRHAVDEMVQEQSLCL